GNVRLVAEVADELKQAEAASQALGGEPARCFKDFSYRPHRNAWSRARRVVGKAEVTQGEANPRFVVTSLKPGAWPARVLYEDLY
ncbi:transposase, partial [Acinetobacter baumannii]